MLRWINRCIPLLKCSGSTTYQNSISTFIPAITSYRFKYSQNHGVKGIKPRKFEPEKPSADQEESNGNELNLEDSDYEVVASSTMNISRQKNFEQNVLIIQPYVKWGRKMSETSPDLKLQEAEALVRSLPQWNIALSMKVPLESLEKKAVFGSGKLEELKKLVNDMKSKKKVSCIFISKGTLSFSQKRFLESGFNLPVMDRYSVVIQILRLHATSAEAKLQVAMAEIPYIWGQFKDLNVTQSRKQGYFLSDAQKEMLKNREKKLKQELENIRSHRKLLRNKRIQKNYPVVAVVGYTNAGKTSLIKALTNEQTMEPKDQLFATLDVTAHAGVLPCNLDVIYMDTVGFMSDIPTGLIECFVATLEDAMLADVIIHVQDLAHDNCSEQKKHVEETLKSLSLSTADESANFNLDNRIINVGNKVDLLGGKEVNQINLNLVSSKTLSGIQNLLEGIECKILELTERKKITIRCKSGGEEMAWLYKNSSVIQTKVDPKSEENILIHCVITDAKMNQFKHYFVNKN